MKKSSSNNRIAFRKQSLTYDLVASALEPYGVAVTPGLAEKICLYVRLLLRWNDKLNLTAIIEPRRILERHFGESLFAVGVVPILAGRLVDIGSGAGFPALPIKLVRPGLSVNLLEPNKKKAAFLAEVCRTLRLDSVQVVACRFHSFQRPSHLFEYATCRAVGSIPDIVNWAAQIVQVDGKLVLWLGRRDAEHASIIPGWRWWTSRPVPGSKERILLIGSPDLRAKLGAGLGHF